jgi:heme oxygenase (biliverdin-IX-beta and delta-forming)
MSAVVTTAHMSAQFRTSASLRLLLREATAAAHMKVDTAFKHLNLQRLPDYRCFLEAIALALLPLEASLVKSGVEKLFPDWALRSRGAALCHDIIALGGVAPSGFSPDELDCESVLGTLYVLEGSRLGSELLLRTVQASSDPRVARCTGYLSHGLGLRLWPTFCVRLEHPARSMNDPAKAIGAARKAFALFEKGARRAARSAMGMTEETLAS